MTGAIKGAACCFVPGPCPEDCTDCPTVSWLVRNIVYGASHRIDGACFEYDQNEGVPIDLVWATGELIIPPFCPPGWHHEDVSGLGEGGCSAEVPDVCLDVFPHCDAFNQTSGILGCLFHDNAFFWHLGISFRAYFIRSDGACQSLSPGIAFERPVQLGVESCRPAVDAGGWELVSWTAGDPAFCFGHPDEGPLFPPLVESVEII